MFTSFKLLVISMLLVGQLFVQAYAAPEEVNINTASVEQLAEALTGIGPSRAAAIVEFRETHGAFTSVDELLAVRGIGERVLADNRERIKIKD